MRHIFIVLLFFTFLPLPVLPVKAADPAPLNGIAVIDFQKLMQDSKAADGIRKQLEDYRKSFQGALEKEEQTLRKEQKEILEKKDGMDAPELARKKQELEKKIMDTHRKVQKRRRALEKAADEAALKLRKEVVKVVAELSDENGYQLVLMRRDVVLAVTELDVTDIVMERLNKRIKKIKLTIDEK